MSEDFTKEKKVKVHLPSRISPKGVREHELQDESVLYQNREFVNMRIQNLETQLDEMELSMALASERHEYFVKSGTNEEDHNLLEATHEMILEIDKEYERAKAEITKLRAHLSTLE